MNRLRLLQGVLGLCLVLLWIRLGQLQIIDHEYWKRRGEDIRVWEEVLPARRGRLLDRRGRELADNLPWVGERPLTPALQARLAEAEEVGRPRTTIEARRTYLGGALAAHLVGFVSEGRGRDGLEKALDKQMLGQDGVRQWLVTAQGQRLRLIQERAPVAGKDMALSLDADLQKLARDSLASVLQQLGSVRPALDQPAGAVVLMEADTGRILAMVSLPDFDPNALVDPRRHREVAALLKAPNSPMLNRAIAGQYPAASTFKIVTASAALENHRIPPERRFSCSGVKWVGDTPFHCFVRTGHGVISFEDSLAYSCDCAFYELGLELGGPLLNQWAHKWGLGNLTGIELPGEQAGYLPRPEEAGEVANLSIGQGQLLVTPLQMTRLVAAVAMRGKMVQPTLLASARKAALAIEMSAPNWDRLQSGMQGAVTRGTAASAVRGVVPPGFAGKTGTVENSPSQSNPRGYNHTWFVAYCQPPGRSPLAVVVFLERSGGYGGALAAPVAVAVLNGALR